MSTPTCINTHRLAAQALGLIRQHALEYPVYPRFRGFFAVWIGPYAARRRSALRLLLRSGCTATSRRRTHVASRTTTATTTTTTNATRAIFRVSIFRYAWYRRCLRQRWQVRARNWWKLGSGHRTILGPPIPKARFKSHFGPGRAARIGLMRRLLMLGRLLRMVVVPIVFMVSLILRTMLVGLLSAQRLALQLVVLVPVLVVMRRLSLATLGLLLRRGSLHHPLLPRDETVRHLVQDEIKELVCVLFGVVSSKGVHRENERGHEVRYTRVCGSS